MTLFNLDKRFFAPRVFNGIWRWFYYLSRSVPILTPDLFTRMLRGVGWGLERELWGSGWKCRNIIQPIYQLARIDNDDEDDDHRSLYGMRTSATYPRNGDGTELVLNVNRAYIETRIFS